jgi:hypothetical protein
VARVDNVGLDAVRGVERLLGDSGGGGGGGGRYMFQASVGAMAGKYQQVYGGLRKQGKD